MTASRIGEGKHSFMSHRSFGVQLKIPVLRVADKLVYSLSSVLLLHRVCRPSPSKLETGAI